MVLRGRSGTPLEVDEDDIEELRNRPGAELVDFDGGRVNPHVVVDVVVATRVFRSRRVEAELRASIWNAGGARYAHNFGNPFSGTHLGAPRTAGIGVSLAWR